MVAIQDYDGNDGRDTAANNGSHSARGATGWRGWKERGKQAYLKGEYASALQAFSQAAQRQRNPIAGFDGSDDNGNSASSSTTTLDQQILLSNMVACRLKLGGAAQSEAAVSTAQRCIALNPGWYKGHVRLAEAYLSLAGCGDGASSRGSSDGAREALRRAIDLEPGNRSARDMLAKMDGDRVVGDNDRGRGVPETSAPPEHMDENRYSSTHGGFREEQPTLRRRRNNNANPNSNSNSENPGRENSVNDVEIEDDDNVYENYSYTPSWQDRLASTMERAKSWYRSLSEDQKSIVKVLVSLMLLYVAFGGRFGLEYIGKNNAGAPHRRSNEVYEDFYQRRSEPHHGYHSSQSYGRSSSSSSQNRDGYYRSHRSRSSSYSDIYSYFSFFLVAILLYIGNVDLPRAMRWRRYGGLGGNGFFRHRGWGGNGFLRQRGWMGNGYPRYGYRRRGGMWGR